MDANRVGTCFLIHQECSPLPYPKERTTNMSVRLAPHHRHCTARVAHDFFGRNNARAQQAQKGLGTTRWRTDLYAYGTTNRNTIHTHTYIYLTHDNVTLFFCAIPFTNSTSGMTIRYFLDFGEKF